MKRLTGPLALLVLAAGCGGNGSGKPLPTSSTSTTAPTTSQSTPGPTPSGSPNPAPGPSSSPTPGKPSTTSTAWIPTNVQRNASGYTWATFYTPSGASAQTTLSAGVVDASSASMFLGFSNPGRIDAIANGGAATEATIPQNVNCFTLGTSEVMAAVGIPGTAGSGQVLARKSGTWSMIDQTGFDTAVTLQLGTTLYVFAGESSGAARDGKVETQDPATGKFAQQTTLKGFLPTAAIAFNNEAWVGGRVNGSSGPALVFHGTNATFAAQTLPGSVASGQLQSVTSTAFTDQGLFFGVETRDAQNNLVQGDLLFLDPAQGLVSVNPTTGDAPATLQALDGTLYVGMRSGQLLWIDQTGAFNAEVGFPAATTVSILFANGTDLTAGTNGAVLQYRQANSPTTPSSPSPSPSTPTGSMTVTAISPSSGDVAGGTQVTITGTNFSNVASVQIGGVACSGVQVVSSTQITATTPSGTAGGADVVVVDAAGNNATLPQGFTYTSSPSPSPKPSPSPSPSITYNNQISQIISNDGCLGCHTGFRDLTTYNNVMTYVNNGNLVKKTQSGGSMNRYCGNTDAATIKQWVNAGAPQ